MSFHVHICVYTIYQCPPKKQLKVQSWQTVSQRSFRKDRNSVICVLTDSGRRSTLIWSPSSKPSGTLFCINKGMFKFRSFSGWGPFCHSSSCLRESIKEDTVASANQTTHRRSAASSKGSHLQWALWQPGSPQNCGPGLSSPHLPHPVPACASGSSQSEGWWALWALNCSKVQFISMTAKHTLNTFMCT